MPCRSALSIAAMCNLYSNTTTQEAMRQLFPARQWADSAGNVEPGDIYPNRLAPIIRAEGGSMVLEKARWGLPSPPRYHSKSGIDRGVTNVRNTGSPHWRRWLGVAHRCLVPFDRFAEPRAGGRGAGNAWFQVKGEKPAVFAGLWVPQWNSIRKMKDGETTDDLFAFLTTEANAVIGAIHPKAMPVVLTEPTAWHTWLTAPWPEARALQQPLSDDDIELIEPV